MQQSSAASIKALLDGNERFVAQKPLHQDEDAARVLQISQSQQPFAVVLTCSDSRLSPEIIFDQGLGDLFVIREIGNVATNSSLGSIEYAVEHLNVKLVVVLGHTNCGAVQAALAGSYDGHMGACVDQIQPAVMSSKKFTGDAVNVTAKLNIQNQVNTLKNSLPIINMYLVQGELKIVGAIYNVQTAPANTCPCCPGNIEFRQQLMQFLNSSIALQKNSVLIQVQYLDG